jgi:hypothetical protein
MERPKKKQKLWSTNETQILQQAIEEMQLPKSYWIYLEANGRILFQMEIQPIKTKISNVQMLLFKPKLMRSRKVEEN